MPENCQGWWDCCQLPWKWPVWLLQRAIKGAAVRKFRTTQSPKQSCIKVLYYRGCHCRFNWQKSYSPGKHCNLQLNRFLFPCFGLTHDENSWLNHDLPNCCISYSFTDWNMCPYKSKGRRKRKQEQLRDIQLWFCGRRGGVVSERHFWGCQGYRCFCRWVACPFSAKNWHQLFPSEVTKFAF